MMTNSNHETLEALADAIGEVIFFVALGYICGEFNFISRDAKAVSQIVSQFALPALFFSFAATLDIGSFNWAPIVGMLLTRFIMIIMMGFITFALRLEPFWAQWGILGIFATQSNDIALGMPVINAIWDDDKYYFGDYTVIHSTLALMTSSICIAFILIGESQRPKMEQIEHKLKMDNENPRLLYKIRLKKRYKMKLEKKFRENPRFKIEYLNKLQAKRLAKQKENKNKARAETMDSTMNIKTILTSDESSSGGDSSDRYSSDHDGSSSGDSDNTHKQPNHCFDDNGNRSDSDRDRNDDNDNLVHQDTFDRIAKDALALVYNQRSNTRTRDDSRTYLTVANYAPLVLPDGDNDNDKDKSKSITKSISRHKYKRRSITGHSKSRRGSKSRSQHGHHHHATQGNKKNISKVKCKAFIRVLKSLIKNPLLLSVIVGLLFNLFMHIIGIKKLPKFIDTIVTAMGDSFDFLALLLMGMGMVGKVNKETFLGKNAVFPFCLVIVKMFIMALIARFLVLWLLNYEENLESATKTAGLHHESQLKSQFENFSFFYGLLPPAVTPVVLAQSFNLMPDIITNATIMSTLIAAPYMFITAVLFSSNSGDNLGFLKAAVNFSSYLCNVLSVFGTFICIIGIIFSKRWNYGRMFPISLVFWLLLSQFAFSLLKFMCNVSDVFQNNRLLWFFNLFFRNCCHVFIIGLSIINLIYIKKPSMIYGKKYSVIKWQYGTVLFAFMISFAFEGAPFFFERHDVEAKWVKQFSTECWIWYDSQIYENISFLCVAIIVLLFVQSYAMYTKFVSQQEIDRLKVCVFVSLFFFFFLMHGTEWSAVT